MYFAGPLHYPEYVNIRSHGPHSVYVSWRGVSTGLQEEAVIGYKVRGFKGALSGRGARCSSVVRAFAHGAMGRRIDPSCGEPIELFLVPASAPRLV